MGNVLAVAAQWAGLMCVMDQLLGMKVGRTLEPLSIDLHDTLRRTYAVEGLEQVTA